MHACAAQGWGNFINTAVICILLAIFGQTGKHYNNRSLEAVWRLSFGLGLIPVTAMLIYRLFFLQESKVWIRKHKGAEVRFPSDWNVKSSNESAALTLKP